MGKLLKKLGMQASDDVKKEIEAIRGEASSSEVELEKVRRRQSRIKARLDYLNTQVEVMRFRETEDDSS